ncbi:MAG: carboxypeptidase-like regulatory domain-containing protein [Flavobacteriales bacterium]|nr:carboxypeptidase-like regulatory domain-containing protein [Flavobacteriales bacterium]
MKKITILGLWLIMSLCQNKLYSQTTPSTPVADSITLRELISTLERTSSCKVYTDVALDTKVPRSEKTLSVMDLDSFFEKSPYKASVYGDKIFILRGQKIDTSYGLHFPSKEELAKKNEQEEIVIQRTAQSYNVDYSTEKAASENKIYSIGDKYSAIKKKQITLKGRITNYSTGEPMFGVNILINGSKGGGSTDKNGNYSIEIPVGRQKLDIHGMMVKPTSRQVMVYDDGILNIEVMEDVEVFEEVRISAERTNKIRNAQIGVEAIQTSKIKNIPMVLGEVDILRVIQTLPGVKTVGEASSGFNVRGGATDQNLILLNNGTIFNPNHLFGFFTAFSADMIQDAELFKSSIPAKYGGRISSVLNINGKEASKEKFTGSAGIGLVTSNANLEIPLAKNRSSLLISGRTTYSDWILGMLPDDSGYKDGSANFYDMGLTFSQKIGQKNILNIYGYYSHDQFAFTKNEKYAYDNMNFSAKWRTMFSSKFMMNLAMGYDHYDYMNRDANDLASAFKLSFDINQYFAKADFTLTRGDHNINFGINTIMYNVDGGKMDPWGDETQVVPAELQREKALETALYIGDEWKITPKLTVNYGLRYSMFNAMGPRTYNKYTPGMLPYEETVIETVDVSSGKIFQTYQTPEIRISGSYALRDNLSIKAGFNTMSQYIHKLSNTVTMSPTDTWKLSDANIRPQKGWQAAGGLYYTIPRKDVEMTVEGYYKHMNDYLDYRGGAQLIMNEHIETDVVNAEGYAYGVELSIRKMSGKLSGWLSYTYSRTFLRQSDKQIPNPVNDGNWYPTNYDKPHDFKMVANYKITDRLSLSLNLDYSTGRPTTVPAGKYFNTATNSMQVYYTDRNTYRLPDYFRGDAAFNIEPTHNQAATFHSKISIGVYNFTGRKNVYSIYYLNEGGKINGYQLSIFGAPIPYVTYSIKF